MKFEECPVARALHFIGGKWKPLILHELMGGPLRASELARRVPEVLPKVLTEQLRQLESDGLIAREVRPQFPPHVEYSFTEFGQSLRPSLRELCKWGERSDVQAVVARRTGARASSEDARKGVRP
ncbi:MAG TPA: helix-turn-helix domain-containing protein [Opitutaceae bacterium]|nr:helix-turn-helix domain-containing protein [Opitutaceae bacterium]